MSKTEVFDINKIVLVGTVVDEPKFSHEVPNKEKIYEFEVECKRESGYVDILKCLIPEVFIANITKGKTIKLEGEIRTRNAVIKNQAKTYLEIRIFVKEEPVVCDGEEHSNTVFLKGTTCKKVVFRETPLGRKIADLLVAVNRPFGKSDYLPCIVWGRNAIMAKCYEVGTKIEIKGRFQSREYQKKIEDDVFETRLAYEVSVSSILQLEEINDEK